VPHSRAQTSRRIIMMVFPNEKNPPRLLCLLSGDSPLKNPRGRGFYVVPDCPEKNGNPPSPEKYRPVSRALSHQGQAS